MRTQDRTIRVSAGAAEYVTGRVEETNGLDISTATFETGLGGYDSVPASWYSPATVTFSNNGATAEVSWLIDASIPAVEQAHLWVRVTDAPEVLPRRCDGGTITVE